MHAHYRQSKSISASHDEWREKRFEFSRYLNIYNTTLSVYNKTLTTLSNLRISIFFENILKMLFVYSMQQSEAMRANNFKLFSFKHHPTTKEFLLFYCIPSSLRSLYEELSNILIVWKTDFWGVAQKKSEKRQKHELLFRVCEIRSKQFNFCGEFVAI